eukprot:gene35870-43509_t
MDVFIRTLPKAELHLHLEGTVQATTLVELSQRVDAVPLTIEEAIKIYEYDDFTGFLRSFSAVSKRLVGAEEYEIIAYRMIERLSAQGVSHAEVYFAVGELFRAKKDLQLDDREVFEDVFAALERARVRAEKEFGVSVFWLLDTTRHEGVEEATRVFKIAAAYQSQYPSIIGVGIGGDERVHASEPFRQLFKEAAAVGLRLTNHAGENTPASFIWEAMSIGSERLGHAYSAIQDAALVEELRRSQLPLELNPSSNVKLGNCPDFKSHPLRQLFDAGLLVTLNSDDPAFFGSNVENEYWLAHSEQQFTRAELKQLAINSFKASFLPDDKKQFWIAKVHAHATD